ncbi:MAG TPA: MarR family transcriptional regulator [Chloroflexota bacterium]|nr:MarR family transcriptional regulator [Chloroflexota bacterium]
MNDELVHDDRITLWGLFLEVYAGIGRRLARELCAAVDLPEAWLDVLLRIGRTPGQRVRMTDLANMVLFSSGGFTKLADRMEQAGLIRREPCPEDRRAVYAVLTPRGREMLDRALAVHLPGLQRYLCDPLSSEQRRDLEGILRTLRAALAATGHALPPGPAPDCAPRGD